MVSSYSFQLSDEHLGNKELQPMDLNKACQELNIFLTDDLKNLRIPGMPVSTELWPHQVTAIAQIKENMTDGRARGTILADTPGLGKTIVTAGVLQDRLNTIERSGTSRYENQPWLIVLPPFTVMQFATDLRQFAPGIVICIYDEQKAISGYNHITRLDGSHEIFGRPDAYKHVVLTSNPTFASRHGLSRSDKFLEVHCPPGNFDCLKESNTIWPEDLCQKFEGVVVDEAHSIRSLDTHLARAIFYLNAKTHLLLTGTPFVDSINDFEGYLYFLQSWDARAPHYLGQWDADDGSTQNSEHADHDWIQDYDIMDPEGVATEPAGSIIGKWWTKAFLKPQGLASDFNPFELDVTLEAANARFSVRAFKNFVINERDNAVREKRMRQLWKRLIIRRIYESAVPGNPSKMISDGLPAVYKRTVPTKFDLNLNKILERRTSRLLGELFKMSGTSGGMTRDRSIERRLQLLQLWIDFEEIQAHMETSSISEKLRNKTFLHWAVQRAAQRKNPTIEYDTTLREDQNMLLVREILRGAPKLRALVWILADKVFKCHQSAIIWCNSSAAVILTSHMLEALGHNVVSLYSDMNPFERQDLEAKFNTNPKEDELPIVLVTTYKLAAYGLNLQKVCFYAAFLDQAPNDATFCQAVGRIRRIGSPSSRVYIDEFVLENSWDESYRNEKVKQAIRMICGEPDQDSQAAGKATMNQLSGSRVDIGPIDLNAKTHDEDDHGDQEMGEADSADSEDREDYDVGMAEGN